MFLQIKVDCDAIRNIFEKIIINVYAFQVVLNQVVSESPPPFIPPIPNDNEQTAPEQTNKVNSISPTIS